MSTLSIITCPDCGVSYGLDIEHKAQLRETGGSFWCPNGHSQYFERQPTKVQKLSKRLEEIQGRYNNLSVMHSNLRIELKDLERSRAALRGQITKLKKKQHD